MKAALYDPKFYRAITTATTQEHCFICPGAPGGQAAKRVCGVERPVYTNAQAKCLRTALDRSGNDIQFAVRKAEEAYSGGRLREGDAAER